MSSETAALCSGSAAMATTFCSRPAPPGTAVLSSPTRGTRAEVARRRQGRRRAPLRIPPEADSKPISWPDDFKRHLPVGRLIRLDSSRPVDAPFFTMLNYDVRGAIYDTILAEAGFRQHIFCPSVSRLGRTKELYSRYLIASKCSDDAFSSTLACGHWECERAQAEARPAGAAPECNIADLVALMRACKFSYLEISDHLYRSVTFTFGSPREMAVFLDRTADAVLARIRAVALIAHALPWDTKACYDFIHGAFFRTDAVDTVALLKRFPALQKLDVNFFPSQMLAAANQLSEMVKPLEELPNSVDVTIRLPTMIYGKGPDGDMCLPLAPKLGDGARFSLLRPAVNPDRAQECCKAFCFQFEKNRAD